MWTPSRPRRKESLRDIKRLSKLSKAEKKTLVGQFIQYYDQGLYGGYVVKIGKADAIVQPIGAKGGKKPHTVTVRFENLVMEESEPKNQD
jgi:hypothetical protein